MTDHVIDDLELFALGALGPGDADRVMAHVGTCGICQAALAELAVVVNTLPDMVPPREPPVGLKQRILTAASLEVRPARRRETAWSLRPARSWLPIGALAAAVVLLAAVDLGSLRELQAAEAQRAQYSLIAEKVSHGGRNWYMAGLDQWQGSGGTLFAPAKPELKPFVVFHDLPSLQGSAMYALWLIDPDGHWTRGANFAPDGHSVQSVDLNVPVEAFTWCAVTIELSPEGRPAGPVVLRSPVAAPAQ